MLSENEKRIKELCQELGQCLYEQSQVEKFNNLAEIEETVRDLMIGVCQPRNRYFFVKTSTGETAGRTRKVKSILGELPITEKQAKKLEVKPRTQMSPMLEKNCLLLSGDESYEKSAQKIKSLTGIAVSHSTQQRLVHR
ncbi:MAG: ISKra4 family transposase, partial [Microcystis sp. M037S2]|nr:ISKra4 family transposase [Microcystis sp. M037S2]